MGVSGNGNHYESVGEKSSTDQGSNKAHIYSGLDVPPTMKNSRDGRLIQIVLIVVGGIVLTPHQSLTSGSLDSTTSSTRYIIVLILTATDSLRYACQFFS